MDKINLEDSLKLTLVELQEYFNLQVRYNKMLLAKRLGEVSSYFTLFMLLLGLGGFTLFFLSFAFAGWFNELYASRYLGQLIVSGFYFVVILVLFVFRKKIIFGPIRKLFGEIFIGEESDNPEDIKSFKNKTKLTLNLKKHKQDIDDKGEILKQNFEELGGQLTISNIIQTVAINAYNSFVTTSNIAKMVYSLMKRVTSRKKKVKRSKRNKNKELEEEND